MIERIKKERKKERKKETTHKEENYRKQQQNRQKNQQPKVIKTDNLGATTNHRAGIAQWWTVDSWSEGLGSEFSHVITKQRSNYTTSMI